MLKIIFIKIYLNNIFLSCETGPRLGLHLWRIIELLGYGMFGYGVVDFVRVSDLITVMFILTREPRYPSSSWTACVEDIYLSFPASGSPEDNHAKWQTEATCRRKANRLTENRLPPNALIHHPHLRNAKFGGADIYHNDKYII